MRPDGFREGAEPLTPVLCPRPHVCAEQELTLVGRRQPCVRAFSRAVPVWKPGCGRQAWCVSHERRYVGPGWERGCAHVRSRVAGLGMVLASGPPVPPQAPRLPEAQASHPPGAEAGAQLSCWTASGTSVGGWVWGPGRREGTLWGRTPWGGGDLWGVLAT